MCNIIHHRADTELLCRCLAGVLFMVFSVSAFAVQPLLVHGLWVWKGPSIVQSAQEVRMLARIVRIPRNQRSLFLGLRAWAYVGAQPPRGPHRAAPPI